MAEVTKLTNEVWLSVFQWYHRPNFDEPHHPLHPLTSNLYPDRIQPDRCDAASSPSRLIHRLTLEAPHVETKYPSDSGSLPADRFALTCIVRTSPRGQACFRKGESKAVTHHPPILTPRIGWSPQTKPEPVVVRFACFDAVSGKEA